MNNLILIFVLLFAGFQEDKYVCMPCGSDCDKQELTAAGECPHCHMKLVKKSTVNFGSISPQEICNYISKHHDVVLLDVRTKEEYEGTTDDFGTLKNAINIPIQELESRVSELDKYKNREVIVYCSYSKRSPRASYLLTQQGFKNVKNMTGGMSTMTDSGCKK